MEEEVEEDDDDNLRHEGCHSACLRGECGGDPTRSVSQRGSAPARDCSWRARPASFVLKNNNL